VNKFKNSNRYGRPIHVSSWYKFRLPKFNMPAAPLYGRSRVLFYLLESYSVKTPLLAHTPNDLFDQIWRKGVPIGTLVQKFLTPPPKCKLFHCEMRFFVKMTHFLQSQLHKSCTLNNKYWVCESNGNVSFSKKLGVPHFSLSQLKKNKFFYISIWNQRLQVWHATAVCQAPKPVIKFHQKKRGRGSGLGELPKILAFPLIFLQWLKWLILINDDK